MELVIKTYQNQFSTTIKKQIQQVDSAVLNFDINNYGEADLIIPVIEGIEKFDKIELYEVIEKSDNLVFTGYIYDFEISTTDIKLFCRSTKELLNYKLVLSDKSYTSKTITHIIEDLLNDWNTAYGDSWTFFCNDTTTITKDFKTGDNLHDIIEEISGLLGLVWDVTESQIIVKETIGEDRTTGINYKALIFNGKSPSDSDISEPVLTSFPTLRNIVIGIDSTTKSTKGDSTSITNFGALGEMKRFRDGDLATQTQEYLDSRKVEQKIFKFEVYDTQNINAGDKVKLIIEEANDYLNFDGTAIINTQRIEYLNRDKIVTLGVSSIYVYQDTIKNRLKQLDKNIKLLTV